MMAEKKNNGGRLRLSTQSLCLSFLQEILDGIHVPGDTYKAALYTSAATLGASTTAYTATGEVANGNGYTTGGQTLTGRAVSLDGSTAILDFNNPVWDPATITARTVLIYNSTKANRAVAVLNFSGDVTSTNGPFTVQFPAPTAADGLIKIAAA
jgi:hypothetical protein